MERCRLLLHVVDISQVEGRNAIEDIKRINCELERYSPELAKRPQIIVANKCDMLNEEITDVKAFEDFVDENGYETIYVSAVTGENLDELVRRVSERLKMLPPLTVYESDYSPEDEYAKNDGERETTVRNENETFVVEGEWLYNLMGQINFDDYESLNYFQKVLIKAGVIKLLEEKGAKDGDTVSIYDFEFDFVK